MARLLLEALPPAEPDHEDSGQCGEHHDEHPREHAIAHPISVNLAFVFTRPHDSGPIAHVKLGRRDEHCGNIAEVSWNQTGPAPGSTGHGSLRCDISHVH